jgi:anti-sigma28 factor (negative regulator of flagellin synthesis)
MNPIDNDRTGISFVREQQTLTEVNKTNKNDSDMMIKKDDDNQFMKLLALVKDATDSSQHLDKLKHIKNQIHADSYAIDFDSLAHNILVSDYEL